MSNRHLQRADKVVSEFKEIIGQSGCDLISNAHFQDLTLLVRDAITDEVMAIAEQMEKVIKEMRSDTDLNDLGL